MDWNLWVAPGCLLLGGLIGAGITSWTTRSTAQARVTADRDIADRKVAADLELADKKVMAENVRLDRDRRIAHYQNIQDSLPSLMVGGLNQTQINGLLAEVRRLWLIAPPSVVRYMNDFVEAIVSGKEHHELEKKLGEMILSFRNDLISEGKELKSFSVLLSEADFRVRSAK